VERSVARHASPSLKPNSSNSLLGEEFALDDINSRSKDNGSANSGYYLGQAIEYEHCDRRDKQDDAIPQ
jgi:hypothetical protein